jgi:branched-chain amino acid transport system permease protein
MFGQWESLVVFTLLNVMLTVGVYVTAMSGQLSLATAAIAGLGGYAAAILTRNFGWPFVPAVLVGAIVGGVVGALIATVTLRMRDFILKLTTLAFGEMIAVVAFNIDYIGGANSFTGIPAYTTFWTCLVALVIATFLAWRFDGSRLGFAARAVRDDVVAAAATGISVLRVRVITFALGAAICGAAGALQAHYMLIVSPQELGFFVSLNFIIFLLFGGMYVLWGAMLGAAVLTVLPELMRFTTAYRAVLFGLIITVVVLFRPQGLIARVPTGVPWPFSRGKQAAPRQGQ